MKKKITRKKLDNSKLGEFIIMRREAKELTLRDAGPVIGINYQVLSSIERGSTPNVKNLILLLEWLELPLRFFIKSE